MIVTDAAGAGNADDGWVPRLQEEGHVHRPFRPGADRGAPARAEHAVRGRLERASHPRRVRARADAVHRAADAGEVAAALADVREPGAGLAGESRSWLVGILSGTEQRGRWRLAARLRIVALLGGVKLDLGAAEVQAPVSTITVLAILGGAEISAPAGVSVQLSGASLFGGRGDERSPGPPLPGSPLIRVRSFALFGGVKVTQARRPAGAGRRTRRGRPCREDVPAHRWAPARARCSSRSVRPSWPG